MKSIELRFVSGVGGFSAEPLTYTQVCRQDNVAVYERSRDGKVKDYEVIVIKIRKAGTQIFNATTTEDEECYPSTGQWGRMAWSFRNRLGALDKYNTLLNKRVEIVSDTPEDEPTDLPLPKAVPSPLVMPVSVNLNCSASLELPSGEFSTAELAAHNNTQYITASVWIRQNPGRVVLAGKRKASGGRGKPTNLFRASE